MDKHRTLQAHVIRLHAQACTECNQLLLSQLNLGHFNAILEVHWRGTSKNQVLELEIYIWEKCLMIVPIHFLFVQYLASIRQYRHKYQLRT